MPEPTERAVSAGAATYTRGVLFGYDIVVLALTCRLAWRCPRSVLRDLYDRNIGARHLDLGPGTGYFLRHCRYPAAEPALTLVDLNSTVLETASGALAHHAPAVHQRDVLRPLRLHQGRFDSIGMNFLLHCLPGGMAHKARVFDHAREYLAPGGRIFGATVLAEGVRHTRTARRLLRKVNDNSTFDNLTDSLHGLEHEIGSRFTDFRVTVVGSVALFEIGGNRCD